jgi:hypothetical protein
VGVGVGVELLPNHKKMSVATGIALCLIAAFTGALSMNVQQMALSNEKWRSEKKNAVWFIGLLLYLVSQVISVMSLAYGPLALMAALFTTMLFFDAAIAFFLIGKKPLVTDLFGLFIIFFSVMVIAFFGPKTQYTVTTDKIVDWVSAPTGIVVVVGLPLIFGSMFVAFKTFNATYPNFRTTDSGSQRQLVPPNLELGMMFVYPALLGTCESVGQLSLKAVSSMAAETSAGNSQLSSPVFYVCAAIWLTCIVNTIIWLRTVYAKFTTVECLPVEYGTFN